MAGRVDEETLSVSSLAVTKPSIFNPLFGFKVWPRLVTPNHITELH